MPVHKYCLLLLILLPLSVFAAKKSKQPKVLELPEISENAHIAIKAPETSGVIYHAKVNYDRIDVGHGSFLYPAPDPATFLAGVLTHALLVGSMKDKKKKAKQQAADAMLGPYGRVINSFTYDELLENGIASYSSTASSQTSISPYKDGKGEYVLESAPVFLMLQSEDALIIQNTVALYARNKPEALLYKNSVEVVSSKPAISHLRASWLENDGEKLKELSIELYAKSLEIVLDSIFDRHPRRAMPQQTFRYFEGNKKKIERGELVSSDCTHVLMKTLWNTLKSAEIYQTQKDIDACNSLN